MKLDIIYNEECLAGMKKIEDHSVDMILCDLPYGTTQCKWDSVIDLPSLWEQYYRVAKENAAIVLTAAQPFTTILINSNIKDFKYTWVWEKSKATGYLNAKKAPLKAHEDICVFYRKQPAYNPQMVSGEPYNKGKALRTTEVYGGQREVLVQNEDGLRYPRTVLYFKTAESEGKVIHPTQKPVCLMEYFIRTYTNEGDVVLDNCMGSGSTAIACINTKRHYIGFELDTKYYEKAVNRVEKKLLGPTLLF